MAVSGVNSNSQSALVTIKYDSDGREKWVASYDGEGNHPSSAKALTLDTAGSICVAGTSRQDILLNRYDGPDHREDPFVAMAIDPLGNAYLTGYSESSTESFHVVIKYDQDGKVAWLIRDKEVGVFPTLDGDGNLYLLGALSTPTTKSDYVITKYDSNGNQLWLHRLSKPGEDSPTAITVDPSGNVYVTGDSDQLDGTDRKYFTVKYIQLPQPDTRLSSPALISNGLFQFLLQGETNRAYSVQSSSNLADWKALTNLTLLANPASIRDPATSSQRFYRAIKQPQE